MYCPRGTLMGYWRLRCATRFWSELMKLFPTSMFFRRPLAMLLPLVAALCCSCSSPVDSVSVADGAASVADADGARDPEATGDAGVLVWRRHVPYREGGLPAIITDAVYGAEFSAVVAFDAAQPAARPVPRGIGGINLEVQFNAFNLVTDRGELRDSVVQRLEQLHLASKSIRWPGGGYDELDYSKSLGQVATRPMQTFFGGDPQRCIFGPAEAAELAKRLGAELWMQVQPMLVAAPPDDQQHVRHGAMPVHEHNSGQPGTIDHRVTNWQIGNEQYHYAAEVYAVEQYITAARHMMSAMKEVDPTIRIWAPVQVNYSNNHFSRQPDWTAEVLRHLGANLYGLTVHNGYAPVAPQANSAEEVAGAYRAMFSNALWASENLQAIEKLIREFGPAEPRGLRLAVTEANAMFGILPFEHNLMNHAQTLGSAAYMATMLAAYARHPLVDYVHLFTGVQFTAQGLIGVTDGTFTTAPDTFSAVGLLLHLWNPWAQGDALTDVDVQSPRFASPAMGWMLARDDIPFVDAFVRRSADDLGIMLVNRSLTQSARVELRVANAAPSSMTARALLGRAPDSNPGLTIPAIVRPVEGAALERFGEGGEGEVWVRIEQVERLAEWPSIRVPRCGVVFLEVHLQ